MSTFAIAPTTKIKRINVDNRTEISVLPFCVFHPAKESVWVCCACHSSYCDDCVTHRHMGGKFTAHICPRPECRGRCVPVQVDPATGNLFPPEEDGEIEKNSTPRHIFKPGRLVARFYLSLILPMAAIIIHDVFWAIQGHHPSWVMLITWAALVFLMSGRRFWAYICVLFFNMVHIIFFIHRIISHRFSPGDKPPLLYIALGVWVVAFLMLAISWQEFTE